VARRLVQANRLEAQGMIVLARSLAAGIEGGCNFVNRNKMFSAKVFESLAPGVAEFINVFNVLIVLLGGHAVGVESLLVA